MEGRDTVKVKDDVYEVYCYSRRNDLWGILKNGVLIRDPIKHNVKLYNGRYQAEVKLYDLTHGPFGNILDIGYLDYDKLLREIERIFEAEKALPAIVFFTLLENALQENIRRSTNKSDEFKGVGRLLMDVIPGFSHEDELEPLLERFLKDDWYESKEDK